MMHWHVILAKANLRDAQVKGAQAPSRSQNQMPPEAAHAVEQAQKAQKSLLKP